MEKIRSIIYGLLNIHYIGGEYDNEDTSSDAEHIANDWKNVGAYIYNAMSNYNKSL